MCQFMKGAAGYCGKDIWSPLVSFHATEDAMDTKSISHQCDWPTMPTDFENSPAGPAVYPATAAGGKRRGGPRTPAGKAISRQNAFKHGLTAGRQLSEILDAELVQRRYAALRQEWLPATPTQDLFVRDMARHQAALERVEQIELAVLRRGAAIPLNMGLDLGQGDEPLDASLAAAGTSDGIERISRYRRQHERALLRDLAALREVKTLAQPRPMKAIPPRQPFCSEEDCKTYLRERARRGIPLPAVQRPARNVARIQPGVAMSRLPAAGRDPDRDRHGGIAGGASAVVPRDRTADRQSLGDGA